MLRRPATPVADESATPPVQRRSRRGRRVVALTLAVAGVASIGLASASSLPLLGKDNTKVVQAGTVNAKFTDVACQPADKKITVEYVFGASPTELTGPGSFGYSDQPTGVRLTNIDDSCRGKYIRLMLGGDSTKGKLAETTAFLNAAAVPAVTYPFSGFVPSTTWTVSDIRQVAVVIHDGTP